MSRESAEDKIARIIEQRLAKAKADDEEAKNPAWAQMRRIIREEVAGILGDAKAPRRGRPADEDQDEESGGDGPGLLEALGFK